MKLYDEIAMNTYMDTDKLTPLLQETSQSPDEHFATQRWLWESPPKRMIYWDLYGDLLRKEHDGLHILDVGGGYCSLIRQMAETNRYDLVEIMAHDDKEAFMGLVSQIKNLTWWEKDWFECDLPHTYDIVIANDLFPNVDQRLDLFLEKILPLTREVRLSLTYYNSPKTYKVKRVGADEIFFIVAWDGATLLRVLEKHAERVIEYAPKVVSSENKSLFSNGRQICHVRLRGGSSKST